MSDAFFWTPDRIEILRALWDDGLSGAAIAVELGGITRSSVIGKVHRLGIKSRKNGYVQTATPRSARNAESKPATRKPSPDSVSKPIIVKQPDDMYQVPIEQRKTLMELKWTTCRWPYGDPLPGRDFWFCGAEADGKYCPYHSKKAGAGYNYRGFNAMRKYFNV